MTSIVFRAKTATLMGSKLCPIVLASFILSWPHFKSSFQWPSFCLLRYEDQRPNLVVLECFIGSFVPLIGKILLPMTAVIIE